MTLDGAAAGRSPVLGFPGDVPHASSCRPSLPVETCLDDDPTWPGWARCTMDAHAVVLSALVSGIVGLLVRGGWDRSENSLHRWLARPAEPDKKSAEMVSARWSQPRQVDGRWQGQIQVTNASSVPILATTVRTPLAGDVDLGAASRESKSSETARLPDGKPPPLHVELHDTRWRLTDGRLELLEPEEARANRVAQLQRANVRRFLLGGAAALSVLAYISPRLRPRWRSRPRRPPRPPTLGPRQQSPWRRRW